MENCKKLTFARPSFCLSTLYNFFSFSMIEIATSKVKVTMDCRLLMHYSPSPKLCPLQVFVYIKVWKIEMKVKWSIKRIYVNVLTASCCFDNAKISREATKLIVDIVENIYRVYFQPWDMIFLIIFDFHIEFFFFISFPLSLMKYIPLPTSECWISYICYGSHPFIYMFLTIFVLDLSTSAMQSHTCSDNN